MTQRPEKAKVPRRLAAILAADIAGYSALMGADEADTVRSLKEHQAVVLPMIKEHGGRIIDTAGDGILAEFGSVVNAVECAVAIQRRMAERNADVEEARRMRFRIGINQGDVVFDDSRVYGDGVNVAARLESLAEPGGICISRKVYEDVAGKMQLAFVDLGEQHLKNIAQPVRVYRVSGELLAARATAKPALALPDKPSIAVLPFTNLSGDPEQEYFADGMVEDIISGLSRFRWLFVIARNSSFTYKGKAVDVKQVGRELGVRYLLEGSVRKSVNRVRIAGQLIDASSGAHLWADRFDGALEDVFELQDQVTSSVVGAIASRLEQAEIERARRKPTESLDAYDFYLRGLANFYKWTREANNEALRLYYKAIELDPDFPAAYAAAAACFSTRKAFHWVVDREQEIAEARRLARRAVQLGKDDATALALAGFTLAHVVKELDDGAAFLDQGLSVSPNLAVGWFSGGWIKVWLGEPDRAIERFAHGMRLSPIDPRAGFMQVGMAHAHFFAGRYDEAVSWAKMALRERPDSHAALRIAAASCALAGPDEEAKNVTARLLEIDAAFRISSFLQNALGPYRKPEHPEKYASALRKAGLPE